MVLKHLYVFSGIGVAFLVGNVSYILFEYLFT